MSARTMTVYNLTDVETPQLKKLGKVNSTFVVGRITLAPGQKSPTEDDPMTRQHVGPYVKDGMASINVLPPAYVVAKQKMQQVQSAEQSRQAAISSGNVGGIRK